MATGTTEADLAYDNSSREEFMEMGNAWPPHDAAPPAPTSSSMIILTDDASYPHRSMQDGMTYNGAAFEPWTRMTPPSTKGKKKATKKAVFVCTEPNCGKQFPRSFALRRHLRIHTGTKPYACDYEGCTQRFNTSGNLSRHKRIHSGERPYPCIFSTCAKRFNTSTKLKRHMRIHFPEGERLFRCIGLDCPFATDNYKEFAQHQRQAHDIYVHAVESTTDQVVEDDEMCKENQARHANYVHSSPDHAGIKEEYHQPPPQDATYERHEFMHADTMYSYGQAHHSLPAMLPKDQKKVHEMDHIYKQPPHDHNSFQHQSNYFTTPLPTFPSAHSIKLPPFDPHPASSSSSSYGFAPRSMHTTNPSIPTSLYLQHHPHHQSPPFRPSDHIVPSYAPHHHHPFQLSPSHLLRPPPRDTTTTTSTSSKPSYGGFAVPPPMNPAAPELTGEELNVVLELMKDPSSY